MRTISISFFVFLFACSGSKSDLEKMEESVREYYFLADTAIADAAIIDTLTLELVEEMLANVDKNLNLVQLDLDTLGIIIENASYSLMELKKSMPDNPGGGSYSTILGLDAEIYEKEIELLKLQLKQQKIEAKKEEYIHTGRILKELKRKSWADVGGFNVEISFFLEGVSQNAEVLMDGEFNIVD